MKSKKIKIEGFKTKIFFFHLKKQKKYIINQEFPLKWNLRKVWTITKKVIYRTRTKSSTIHDKFTHNDKVIIDPKTIADSFIKYFVNIERVASICNPWNNFSYRKFLPGSIIRPSLFLKPSNEIEMRNVISRLKERVPGRDVLLSNNSICIKDSISDPLTNIVNWNHLNKVYFQVN